MSIQWKPQGIPLLVQLSIEPKLCWQHIEIRRHYTAVDGANLQKSPYFRTTQRHHINFLSESAVDKISHTISLQRSMDSSSCELYMRTEALEELP